MKDILLGLVWGYWIRDHIDPGIDEIKETAPASQSKIDDSNDSNLSAGLWLAGISLGIGLLTMLIGWYMLTFISASCFIGGIVLMLTPETKRR